MSSPYYTKPSAARARDPLSAALSLAPLSPAAQAHLRAVYLTLATAVGAAAFGAALQQRADALPLSHVLPALASVGLALRFLSMPRGAPGRAPALHAAAGAAGAATGPLLTVAAAVEPAIPTVAFAATAGVFGSLSAAAVFSRRRGFVYLGGVLGGAVGGLAVIGFANMFMGSAALWGVQLYGGLLVFCGYVLYDSQMIVARAEMGDRDVEGHAFELFTDLAAIFKRLVIIMIQNRQRKQDRDEEDRRRRQ